MTVLIFTQYNQNILWLSLESLKNQQNIYFNWELICIDSYKNSNNINTLLLYKNKLPNCVQIVYLNKTDDLNINNLIDNNSNIIVNQNYNCYSIPNRLHIHYEHFKNNDCYYSVQKKSYIYNIQNNSWNIYEYNNCNYNNYNYYNLTIALKKNIINLIDLDKINNILYDKDLLKDKIIFIDDENINIWKYNVYIENNNTENNNIENNNTENNNIENDITLIDCKIPAYIISYLRIIYLKKNIINYKNLNINKKILINIDCDNNIFNIINKYNIVYDKFSNDYIKLLNNTDLNSYFIIIDYKYNDLLYKKTLEHNIYYYCQLYNNYNNHIINKFDEKILNKLIFRIQCINEKYINNLIEIIKNKKILICSIGDYGFSAYNIYFSLKKKKKIKIYFIFKKNKKKKK